MEGSVTTNIIVIYTVAMREGNKCERETLLDLKVRLAHWEYMNEIVEE